MKKNEFTMLAKTFKGLEQVLAGELVQLGANNVQIGRRMVSFTGDKEMMYKANFHLRTAVRILKPFLHFKATNADEVYETVKAFDWEQYLDTTSTFSVDSVVYSEVFRHSKFVAYRVKDAIADYFNEKYGERPSIRVTNPDVMLDVHISGNEVTISLDSSGESLHKRGYRAVGNDAPLHETLAAGMIQLTRFRGREFFWDPFCGSGTIPIEAALIAKNRAPGLNRHFAAEEYPWMPASAWDLAKEEAKDKEFNGKYRIMGSDNDPSCVSLAFANARKAGVADAVTFQDGDATKMSLPCDSGILVCNPPYGERMMEQSSAQRLYSALGRHLKFANDWKKFIITSEPEFEHYFGRRADKKRKLYNGMIKCDYYMFTENKRKK